MTEFRLRMRHPLGCGLLALLLFAVTGSHAQEPLVIRIGYAAIGLDNKPYANGSIAATARAANSIEAEFKNDPNIKVEWHFFRGAGPAVNEAIANHQVDLAYQGDLPAISARAAGLKTKLLLASGAHTPLYLAAPSDSDLKSVKDLKGRKVALFRGTSGHLAAAKVLAANGLSERDLQIVNMDYAAATAALISRDLDGIFGQNTLLGLAEQGLAKIVYTTKGDNPSFGRNGHVLVTEDFEARHPAIVARVVKAFVKIAHWSSQEENREAVLELWAKSGTPVSILRADLEGEPLQYRNSPLVDDFFIEQYRAQARQARELGLVRRDIDVQGWFDTRYLDAALKELKLERFWTRYGADGKPLGS